MADFKFNCPHCKLSLEAPADTLGQQINCPSCSGAIQLPNPHTQFPAAPSMPLPDQTRACSFCGEAILVVAIKCKHCGEFLDGRKTQMATPPPSPPLQPTKAKYNPSMDTFTGNMAILVKLAMRSVHELGWKLDNANENLGIVTFETGISWGSWSGVSCSLNIEEVSPNQFRVTGIGKQNVRGGQLVAVNLGGEAKGKAQKAIDKMKELALPTPTCDPAFDKLLEKDSKYNKQTVGADDGRVEVTCDKCQRKLDPEKELYWCPNCNQTVGICCIGWWSKCRACGTRLETR
jgi:Zn finger protein HypA/HybF involved in hydrogenase expression